MIAFTNQLSRRLKLWLLAATTVLLLTSIIDAGHIHDIFDGHDSQCTLCLHTIALDNPLCVASAVLIPKLLDVSIPRLAVRLHIATLIISTAIRAPPIVIPRN